MENKRFELKIRLQLVQTIKAIIRIEIIEQNTCTKCKHFIWFLFFRSALKALKIDLKTFWENSFWTR